MYLVDVEEDEVDDWFGNQRFAAFGTGLPHRFKEVPGDECQTTDIAAAAEKR